MCIRDRHNIHSRLSVLNYKEPLATSPITRITKRTQCTEITSLLLDTPWYRNLELLTNTNLFHKFTNQGKVVQLLIEIRKLLKIIRVQN